MCVTASEHGRNMSSGDQTRSTRGPTAFRQEAITFVASDDRSSALFHTQLHYTLSLIPLKNPDYHGLVPSLQCSVQKRCNRGQHKTVETRHKCCGGKLQTRLEMRKRAWPLEASWDKDSTFKVQRLFAYETNFPEGKYKYINGLVSMQQVLSVEL